MKLSEIVKLRNSLQQISLSMIKASVNEVDGQLSGIYELPSHITYKDSVGDLLTSIDSIEHQIGYIENKIPELITNIEQELEDRTKELLSRGYMINGGYGSDSTDVISERLGRQMLMHDGTRSEILVRARKYTDWRFPALEIGPGDGVWTEHLIAADPLYIVDVHQEFLDSTLDKFNHIYKNRVRPYLTGMHARRSDTDLSMLPINQFGFIFAWNVFDYFPLSHVVAFLEQSMNLLRPGGIMMFSYNNCDVVQCAEYAEDGFRSWMPKSLLTKTCTDMGFEIINHGHTEETVSWIEIKKPGTLKTVKGHQVMGEIVNL